MRADAVPVRDFTACADPLREMRRHYAESRARMMVPRTIPTIAPPAPKPAPKMAEISMIPPPDYVLTKAAYHRCIKARRRNESAHRPILRVVSAVTGIPITALVGPNLTGEALKARVIAYYLIRSATAQSYPKIATLFKRHHSSVISGCRRVEHAIATLGIEVSSDPVEMSDRLWSSVWPKAPK